MRVAHLIWGLGLGGAELVVVDLVNRQAEAADVGLLIVNDLVDPRLKEEVNGRVRAVVLQRRPGSRDPRLLFRLSRELRAMNPDVIHAHHIGLIKILLPLFLRPKKVVTIHNTFEPIGPALRLYDKVFAVSEAVRQHILAGARGVNARVVHNGVDCRRIRRARDRASDEVRIVHVARLEHGVKGQDVLIDALEIVRRTQPAAEVHLDFIGDGPSLDFLRRKVSGLRLDGAVHFLGSMERDRVYGLLCNYDLAVNTSRTEGFGLTIAEAMAARVPVLVPDLPGPMEIIGSGAYGRFFPPGDAQSCASRILEILEQRDSPDVRRRTERAFLRATTLFELQRTARTYLREYALLVGAPAGACLEEAPTA